jgi:hypothetical protein
LSSTVGCGKPGPHQNADFSSGSQLKRGVGVMVARSARDWRGVSMDRNTGRGSLPTAEQEEGFSLLILAYFISHPLIT